MTHTQFFAQKSMFLRVFRHGDWTDWVKMLCMSSSQNILVQDIVWCQMTCNLAQIICETFIVLYLKHNSPIHFHYTERGVL